MARASLAAALALTLPALLAAAPGAPRAAAPARSGGAATEAGAAGGSADFAAPAPLEWRAAFKLISLTAHAEPGDVGFVREGDDTRESDQQSLRLQLTGRPVSWLDYRFDYLNVKQNLAGAPPPQAQGADLFRRKPWRSYIERPETAPGQAPSTQTVLWTQEVDDAFVRVAAGPLEAVLGRQPISWGAGRIWQPTDVFATFSPLALDTEYKPGVDGLLLSAYPFAFSSLSLAYILSPADRPDVQDSAVLRWRAQVGRESELTALLGRVRGEPVTGGSVETTWLEAGWRLEAVSYRPRDRSERALFAVAGVDRQVGAGTLLLAELYHHSLGATSEAGLPAVVRTQDYRDGRLLQLSRDVLALGASQDFLGLWKGSYTLFGAALRDEAGARRASLLHQLTFTYSISDNAEAVFSITSGSGRGLAPDGSFRSEFGHLPDALYVSLQFVL